MTAVLISPKKKSDVDFLMDFAKRMSFQAREIDIERIDDLDFISMIDEGLKTENVSRKEVIDALLK